MKIIKKETIKNIIKIVMVFILYFAIIYSFNYVSINNINLKSLFASFMSLLFLLLIFRKELLYDIKSFKVINFFKKYVKYYIFAYLLMIFINSIILMIVKDMPTNEQLNRDVIIASPFINIISTCIIAPISEEILFRLNFKKTINNKLSFIIITSIIFGSMHLLVASSTIEYLYIISYSLMGAMLAYVYRDSDNIFTSIMFHSLNNIIAVIVTFIGVFI